MNQPDAENKAAMLDWLLSKCQFRLGGHDGPDVLENAKQSQWSLKSAYVFIGTNTAPSDMLAAIDIAMRQEVMSVFVNRIVGKPEILDELQRRLEEETPEDWTD